MQMVKLILSYTSKGNILHDPIDKTFTCYNPKSVTIEYFEQGRLIGKKQLPALNIFTCDSMIKNLGSDVMGWKRSFNRNPSPYYRQGKVEIEIHPNASPCEDCFAALSTFTAEYEQVFIHVKYASFYPRSDQQSFDHFNSDGGSRLKVTPFTDSDWRLLLVNILKLVVDEIENERKDSESHFLEVRKALRTQQPKREKRL